MSNESLAKKIAQLLDAERPAVELSSIQKNLELIGKRVEKLEAASTSIPQSTIPNHKSIHHPSLDKLAVAEAIADQIFGGADKEKACTFEPNGKPCDHCSMCNSRGF